MKTFFAAFAALVVALWLVAWAWTPGREQDGRTLLYWSTDPNPARKEQIAPFEAKNPDLAIRVEPNTFERTIVQCSTGVGPELIEVYFASDMVSYADAGILMDLTPYAKEYGISPDVTYPGLAGDLVYDGRQYRFPANASSQVLLYNKRLFREAGIAEPTDAMEWDDFVELVRPLTEKRSDGKGYSRFALVMSKDFVRDIHLQFGGHFFNEQRTRCVLDSPESIAGVAYYRDLMARHEVLPTPQASEALSGEGGWGNGELRWFATGRSACLWGARWMFVQLRQYPEMKDNIGVVVLPRAPGRAPAGYCGARGPGINAKSPHRMEALKFLAYLASDDYSRIIAQSSDALPPNGAYAADTSRLVNPDYPWEAFQEKFVASIRNAQAMEISPFVNPKIVDRVWKDMLENVENGVKTPEAALAEATKAINDEIDRTLATQPELKARFEKLENSESPSSRP